MDKHIFILKSYFCDLRDDINDSWRKFEDVKQLKYYDANDEVRFKIADIKNRLDNARIVKERIDNYIKHNEIDGNDIYLGFYYDVLDNLEVLRDKVNKFTI